MSAIAILVTGLIATPTRSAGMSPIAPPSRLLAVWPSINEGGLSPGPPTLVRCSDGDQRYADCAALWACFELAGRRVGPSRQGSGRDCHRDLREVLVLVLLASIVDVRDPADHEEEEEKRSKGTPPVPGRVDQQKQEERRDPAQQDQAEHLEPKAGSQSFLHNGSFRRGSVAEPVAHHPPSCVGRSASSGAGEIVT